MLLHYLKLAIRLLTRNPFFTIISVLGLAIGFTSFFTLWQYSTSELKADQHFTDYDRIGRVGFHWDWTEGGQEQYASFSASKASIPPLLMQDFPEVESFVRISEQDGFFQNDLHEGHGTRIVIAYEEPDGNKKVFKETKTAYADRNMFEFFGIPLLSGEAKTILKGVNFAALSESTARKYFGDRDPSGEQLLLNDSIALKVMGVFEDMPHNSRINYDIIISNEGLLTKWSEVYWGGTQNFIKLRNTSFEEFQEKLRANVGKYWAHILTTCNDCSIQPFVQPMKEIAFSHGLIGDDAFHRKSRPLLIILGWVAFAVLVMGWINYINITVSRFTLRMKEFGARRANGACTADLVVQFLIETTLVNALALGISFTMLQIIRSPLQIFFDIHIPDLLSIDTDIWIVILVAIIGGIAITGLYPAYVSLRLQPRNLLTARSAPFNKNIIPSFLTTVQFTSAIVLILWAFIVHLQLNYILRKNTGYNRDGIIVIDGPITRQENYKQRLETLTEQLKTIPNVDNVTWSRYIIGESGNKPGSITRLGTDISSGVECNAVEENFIPLFGLKLIAGRNFVKDDRANVVIISRPSARALGFENPADAIGLTVNLGTGDWGVTKQAEVIGVIEDYRRFSFFNLSTSNTIYTAGGLGIFLTYSNNLFPELIPQNIAIRIQMKNIDATVASMESVYTRFFPGNIFEWRFLDDKINQTYTYEKITRNQIVFFTALAIGIACLGLLGMITNKVDQKTREIGIRKALGAQGVDIGTILFNTTMWQFVFSALLGLPLSWYLATQYLQKYSEQIVLQWWHFAIPIVILLGIMFSTVASALMKALRTNPADSLRYE